MTDYKIKLFETPFLEQPEDLPALRDKELVFSEVVATVYESLGQWGGTFPQATISVLLDYYYLIEVRSTKILASIRIIDVSKTVRFVGSGISPF